MKENLDYVGRIFHRQRLQKTVIYFEAYLLIWPGVQPFINMVFKVQDPHVIGFQLVHKIGYHTTR